MVLKNLNKMTIIIRYKTGLVLAMCVYLLSFELDLGTGYRSTSVNLFAPKSKSEG